MIGNYRINRRDISWKRRLVGESKSAGDRLDELCLISRKKLKIQFFYHTVNLYLLNDLVNDESDDEDDDDEVENLLILLILTIRRSIDDINRQLARIQFANYQPIERMLRIDITINFLADADFNDKLGFSKEQALLLHHVLNVPAYFIIDAHSIHSKWKVDGLKCFLWYLYRIKLIDTIGYDEMRCFGYDKSTLSKLFITFIKFISQHTHRLRNNLSFVSHRFNYFSDVIKRKMDYILEAERVENNADEIGLRPMVVDKVVLFTDNCRVEIARPSENQRSYYRGDKHIHCIGVQGTMGPDGMLYDIYMEPVGRRADAHFMNDSHLNEIIRDRCIEIYGDNIQHHKCSYQDKGYGQKSHLKGHHKKPPALTQVQLRNNNLMSKLRQPNEWVFGSIYHVAPYLRNTIQLKLYLRDLRMEMTAACLITNFYTIFNGSNSSLYFGCIRPTLEEYMSIEEVPNYDDVLHDNN